MYCSDSKLSEEGPAEIEFPLTCEVRFSTQTDLKALRMSAWGSERPSQAPGKMANHEAPVIDRGISD